MNLIVGIAAHNAEKWIGQCVDSVLKQTKVCRLHIVDDASTDRTQIVALEKLGLDRSHRFHRNSVRLGALANYWRIIEEAPSDAVIVNLDGDDWFLHDRVLEYVENAFNNANTWFLHGSYLTSDGRPVWGTSAFASEDFRSQPCRVAGLRAYRAQLAKKIRAIDLQIGGFWQTAGWDNALCLPMLEMAGIERVRYCADPLIVYRMHEANDRNLDFRFQEFCSWYSRSRGEYSWLSDLDDQPKVSDRSSHAKALALVPDLSGLDPRARSLEIPTEVNPSTGFPHWSAPQ
jgi:glycosyltransferase involved in cell wall biosynthesis